MGSAKPAGSLPALFAAADTGHGTELWRYNGGAATLWKDVRPGPDSSNPTQFTAVGSSSWRAISGNKSLLLDIDGSGFDSQPTHFVSNGTDRICFAASSGSAGRELWTTNSTPGTTALLADVVGVYLSPPQNAVVLCVDKKSQIQALDRTQPGLPMKKGRCGTWTHDYVRNGTTTLLAALEVASGKVTGECYTRHRHQEFVKFLRKLDQEYGSEEQLHLVIDNYATHKHAKVKAWLEKHPRFHLHFIPTSSSWLNLVERWFAELTSKAIRRGSFQSVPDLIEKIMEFIESHNEHAKAFVWTATAEDILAKVEKCRKRLEEINPGCTSRKKRKVA